GSSRRYLSGAPVRKKRSDCLSVFLTDRGRQPRSLPDDRCISLITKKKLWMAQPVLSTAREPPVLIPHHIRTDRRTSYEKESARGKLGAGVWRFDGRHCAGIRRCPVRPSGHELRVQQCGDRSRAR